MATYDSLKSEFSAASMSMYVPGKGGPAVETDGFQGKPKGIDLGTSLGVGMKPETFEV